MPLLTKIALLEATTNNHQLLHNELDKLAKATRKEAGCLQFTFYYMDESSNRIMLFEQFSNQTALKHHMEEAHTQDFFKQKLIKVVNLHDLKELKND